MITPTQKEIVLEMRKGAIVMCCKEGGAIKMFCGGKRVIYKTIVALHKKGFVEKQKDGLVYDIGQTYKLTKIGEDYDL